MGNFIFGNCGRLNKGINLDHVFMAQILDKEILFSTVAGRAITFRFESGSMTATYMNNVLKKCKNIFKFKDLFFNINNISTIDTIVTENRIIIGSIVDVTKYEFVFSNNDELGKNLDFLSEVYNNQKNKFGQIEEDQLIFDDVDLLEEDLKLIILN